MFKREILPLLPIFRAVARSGGFTAASGGLGVSAAAVSQAIQQLEARLGIRLFERTSRSVRLTETGAVLLQGLQTAMEDIDQAVDRASSAAGNPAGTLRITLSRLAAESCILPTLSGFALAYPEVMLELSTDDRLTNIISEEFDAGVRFADTLERDMIARPIGPQLRRTILGSPEYFSRRDKPKHPDQMSSHDVIRYRFPGSRRLEPLAFVVNGEVLKIDPGARLVLDDNRHMAQAVLDGVGLAQRFRLTDENAIAAGLLEEALVQFEPTPLQFHLYYPSRRKTARLQAFIDWFGAADKA